MAVLMPVLTPVLSPVLTLVIAAMSAVTLGFFSDQRTIQIGFYRPI
jgi:hypothetical protein